MLIEELVASILEVPATALLDSSGPTTMRAWNSLKHIQIVASLEKVYGVKLSTYEMQTMTSLAKVRSILRQKGVEI